MPITDDDAAKLTAAYGGLPPEMQVQAKAKLAEWHADRLPAYQAQDQADGARVAGYFSDPNTLGLKPEEAAAMNVKLRGSSDPQGDKYLLANSRYIARSMGITHEQALSQYPVLRDDFARTNYGAPDGMNDAAFYGATRDRLKFMDANLNDASDAALRGELPTEALGRWQFGASQKPGFSASSLPQWQKQHADISAQIAPYDETIQSTLTDLQKSYGVQKDGKPIAKGDDTSSFGAMTQRLLDVPEADRGIVIRALIARGEAQGADSKGFVKQLGESVARGAEGLVSGAVNATDRDLLTMTHRSLASGSESAPIDVIAQGPEAVVRYLNDFNASAKSGGNPAIYALGNPELFRKLTPDETGAARDVISRNLDALDLKHQIRSIAEGTVDPIKRGNAVENLFYDAAKMAPMIGATVIPGAAWSVVMPSFAEENYHKMREAYPTMSRDDAASLASISAPVQQLAFEFHAGAMLGKLPWLNKFLQTDVKATLGSIATRYATRTAVDVGAGLGTMKATEVVTPLVQSLASALNKDVPGTDWGKLYGELTDGGQNFETALSLLPYALFGARGVTSADIQRTQDVKGMEKRGVALGIPAESAKAAADAMRAGDLDTASTAWQDGFQKRGPANLDAVKDLAKDGDLEAKALFMDMRKAGVTIDKVGDQWAVKTKEGGEAKFDSHEDAFTAFKAHADALELKADTNLMQTFEAFSRGAADGEAHTLTGRDASLLDYWDSAEKAGDAKGLADIWERANIERERAGLQRVSQDEATPEEMLDGLNVLGQSVVEFRENVANDASEVYRSILSKRGTAIDHVEEKAEGDVKRWFDTGRITPEQMGQMIQKVELATGDKYQKGEGELAVIEAYSSLARLYVTGIKSGEVSDAARNDQAQQVRNGRKLRDAINSDRSQRERLNKAAGDEGAKPLIEKLKQYAQHWQEVFKRVAGVMKAKKSGDLGEIEKYLMESVGLSEEHAHAKGVEDFVKDMASRGLDLDASNSAFSLENRAENGKVVMAENDSETRKKELQKELGFPSTSFSLSGRHGAWIADDGRVAQVNDTFGHADVIEPLAKIKVTKPEDYQQAYDKGFARLTNTPNGVYVTYGAKSFTGKQKAALEMVAIETGKTVYRDTGTKLVKLYEFKEPSGASFSLAPHDRLEAIANALGKSTRDPEERRAILQKAKDKFRDGAANWTPLIENKRTLSNLAQERASREADAFSKHEADLTEARISPDMQAALDSADESKLKNHPLVEAILGKVGKLMSETEAMKQGKLVSDGLKAGDYDGKPSLPAWLYGGTRMPDQVAQELYDMGLINDAHPDTMWSALSSAIESTSKMRDQLKAANEAMRGVQKDARTAAKTDAETWHDNAIKRAIGKPADRERLVASMRTLDGAVSVLPPELRAKVGGFIKLASLTTDAARISEIERRVEKIGPILEQHFKDFYREQIDDLLDKTSSTKNGSGVRVSGKFNAEGQHFFDTVHKVAGMNEEAITDHVIGLESALASATDTDVQDRLFRELGIAANFGNLDGMDAESLSHADAELQRMYQGERGIRKMADAARKATLQGLRDDGLAALGISDKVTAADLMAKRGADSKFKNKAGQFMNGVLDSTLSTTNDILTRIFGGDSAITKTFGDEMARRANHKAKDIEIHLNDSYRQALADVFTGGKQGPRELLKAVRELSKMKQHQETTGVFVQEGRKVESLRVDRDIAEGILKSGDGSAYGYDANDLISIKAAMDGASGKQKVLRFERVLDAGKPREMPMSQLEGLDWLMLWRQKDSRQLMERQGWDDNSAKQLSGFLRPETKQLEGWIRDSYDHGWKLANPVAERVFHMTMARNENYTTMVGNIAGRAVDESVSALDALTPAAGMSFGAQKERVKHNATLVATDALSKVFGHYAKLSQWVAHVEKIRDMRAVLLAPDVITAVEAVHGKQGVNALRERINSEEGSGQRAAAQIAWLNNVAGNTMKARTYSALAANLGTIMKHMTNVLKVATTEEIPSSSLAMGYGKLLSGELHRNGAVDRVMNSETIRSRMEAGITPEQRVAGGFGDSATGQLEQGMHWGMSGIRYADAKSNGWGAAIAYDYYKGVAEKSGMHPAEADAWAMDHADSIVYHTAVPEDLASRTGLQNNKWMNLALMGMFKTPAVKWSSMEIQAGMRAVDAVLKGEGKAAWRATRTVLVTHLAVGLMEQTIMGLYRFAFTKDDAEAAWSPEHYAEAMFLGPLTGVVGFGELAKDALWSLLGAKHMPERDAAGDVIAAFRKAAKESSVENVSKAAAEVGTSTVGAFSPAMGAAPSVALRMFGYFAHLFENATVPKAQQKK